MDWSPILISMKTASVSIVLTFFLGILAAWWVVSMKNERMKILLDGVLTLPLVLPPTVAGFFLLWGETDNRHLLFTIFWREDRFFLDGHGAGRSGDVLSAHVPLCKGSV